MSGAIDSHVEYASEFGQWRVTFCSPPVHLASVVETFWETVGLVSYGYEKIVPSGTADLMINLGVPQQLLNRVDPNQHQTFRHGWLSGMQTRPIYTAPAPGSQEFLAHFVGARLYPSAIRKLFGIDATDLVDRVVELGDLLGPDASDLYDEMHCSALPEQRFLSLAATLGRLKENAARNVSPTASYAIALTSKYQGNIQINELCKRLNVSRKHLNTLYQSAVGVSPKMFARIERFRGVMDHLDYADSTWAKIATDRGFFDQSHMISDFKRFAGETPESFLANRAPDGEAVNYKNSPDGLLAEI